MCKDWLNLQIYHRNEGSIANTNFATGTTCLLKAVCKTKQYTITDKVNIKVLHSCMMQPESSVNSQKYFGAHANNTQFSKL